MFPYASDRTDGKVIPGHSTTSLPTSTCRPVRLTSAPILKSGLYVTITLPYSEQKDAVLVRDASIGTDQLGKFLYIVNDSNIVRYRHIEPGQLVDDTLRQVISGIRPDERYVTTALLKVRDGMSIKPIK